MPALLSTDGMMSLSSQGDAAKKPQKERESARGEYSAPTIFLAWLLPLSFLFLFSSRTRRVAKWSLLAWLHLLVALTLWFFVAGLLRSRTPAEARLVDLIFFWFFLWVIVATTGVLMLPIWLLLRRRPAQSVQWTHARCLAVRDQNTALELLRHEWERLGVSFRTVGSAMIAVWPLIERKEKGDRLLLEGALAVVPGCSEVAGLSCVALRSVTQRSRLAAFFWHRQVERFFKAVAELCGADEMASSRTPLTKEVEEALAEAATSAAWFERGLDRATLLRLIAVAAVATILSTILAFQLTTESGAVAGVLGLLGGLYAFAVMAIGWWTNVRESVREAFRSGGPVSPSWGEGWRSLRLLALLAVMCALVWVVGLTLFLEHARRIESDLALRALTALVLLSVLAGLVIGAGYGLSQGRKAAR